MDAIASTSSHVKEKPSTNLFEDISGENPEVTEIESLCVACERNGTTRLLMVKIPFYKEVFVSSFSCGHCGYSDTSLMGGQTIQEEGVEQTLFVKTARDLNRTVVMSDYAAVKVPELEFEAPYGRQSFGISTIEGVISRIKDLLQKYVGARSSGDHGVGQLNEFVSKMDDCLSLKLHYHLVIDDPSGNSFIENIFAPNPDPDLTVWHYPRSDEQNTLCGLLPPTADEKQEKRREEINSEIMTFPATCIICHAECQTHMKTVDVPNFKEMLIMSTSCEKCGWKNSEAKPASGIEDYGVEVDVHVTGKEDLNRDVIKSASCALRIPELDFDMLASDHSSRYSTVEGILSNIKDDLVTDNPFVHGDSGDPEKTDKLLNFGKALDEVMAGRTDIHFILDDPAGNSFIQKMGDNDSKMTVRRYERTPEQNEELCLTDMKTTDYD